MITTTTTAVTPTKNQGARCPTLNAPPELVVNRSVSTPGTTSIGPPGSDRLGPDLRDPVHPVDDEGRHEEGERRSAPPRVHGISDATALPGRP